MDYGKSFTYVFKDEKWISKFLIGVVVSLIPIVNLAALGYIVELVKNVRDGLKTPLPEWDEFGAFFFSGLKFFLGTLVYALPIILVSLVVLPFSIIGGDQPGAFIQLAIVAASMVSMLLGILVTLLLPAMLVQFAKREEISDMFAFAEIWDMIRSDLVTYFVILIFLFFATSIVAGAGIIACFIGVFFTSWYAYLISGHLVGQYAALQPGAEKSA
jgi:hypothetical protein